MTPHILPVFGMAGVIARGHAPIQPDDEAWLHSAFAPTPLATRVEWRSDRIAAVTVQHGAETNQVPGVTQSAVPAVDGLEGLLFGQFFGEPGRGRQLSDTSAAFVRELRREGPAALMNINGGWVAVAWDRRDRVAQFVRDRVGSHPLYVAESGDRLFFATDLRLLRAAGVPGDLDEEAATQFLRFLYVPPPRTIYRGVRAVHAAHVLTVDRSERQERYAPPRFVDGPMPQHPPTSAEIMAEVPRFEECLLAAVSDCLPATGRIALALSGGQDSATLAVALSKLCPDRVLAFTVGERDRRLTEAPHAAVVCRALGLEHRVYVPTDEEIAAGLDAFIACHDQPIGDLAAFPYFLGVRQLPDDCTVVLDGSGNDDYFGITGKALALRYRARARVQRVIPDALWPAVPWLMARGPAAFRNLSRYWSKPLEESFVPWEGWPAQELTALTGRRVSLSDTRLYQTMRAADPDRWRLLLTEVVGGIWEAQAGFPKGIHFAHAVGRGMRYPFIDDRVLAWANALPMGLKLDKIVLLAYMERNLPAEIVKKPKSGFIFDLNRLFLNPTRRWANELNARGALRVWPSWSSEVTDRLLAMHAGSPGDLRWQHRLYALCLLAAFVEGQRA